MTEFETSRRQFLKFAAALGVAAAVPVAAIKAVVPAVAKAERFVGPRLEVFIDGKWLQIPGLTNLEPIQLLELAEPKARFFAYDEPMPVVSRTFNSNPGYALEGDMPREAACAINATINNVFHVVDGDRPMRIIWREMLIEFDGFITSSGMRSSTDGAPRWTLDLVTTTQPRIHTGLV